MTIRRTALWLVVAALACASLSGNDDLRQPSNAEDVGLKADLATLQEAGLATDGTGLLDCLRRQTLRGDERAALAQTVRRLGDVSYFVREDASRALLEKGRAALPFLRAALNDSDLEIQRRARRCLDAIESGPALGRLQAMVRLVAERRPAGAAEVLLAYLPFADQDALEDEIRTALKTLGMKDGRPEPALAAALRDPLALKRSTAALVIGQAPLIDDRLAVKPLLQDPEAIVRLRAAEGLLAGKDKDALPILIALLSEAPLPLAWEAEEHLGRIAGEQSPQLALGSGDSTARRKCRAAWEEWWQTEGIALNESRLGVEQRTLGLTLVVVYDGYNNGQGQVWEFDAGRKKRWAIDRNLQGPIDAQVLPGNRVLLAEYNGQRVTERDLTGNVLWEHRVEGNPVACQRLPNGNTFIATLNAVMEVLPNKSLKYIYPVRHNQLTFAQKLRNGQIYHVSSNGVLMVLDSSDGAEIRKFKVGNNTEWLSFDLLAGGNLLVPQQSTNQIIEYRIDGTVAHAEPAPTAYSAVRLPNGNTLGCSMNGSSLFEVNRAGAIVWKESLQGRPFRVRRR